MNLSSTIQVTLELEVTGTLPYRETELDDAGVTAIILEVRKAGETRTSTLRLPLPDTISGPLTEKFLDEICEALHDEMVGQQESAEEARGEDRADAAEFQRSYEHDQD